MLLLLLSLAQAEPTVDAPVSEDSPLEVASPAAASAEQLRAIIAEVEAFQGATVETAAGVLTLRGEMPTAQSRAELAKIAASLPGVIYVQDLTVVRGAAPEAVPDAGAVRDENIEAQLRGIFASVSELSGVQAEVRAGVVHLQGTMSSTEHQERLRALVEGLEGVVYIDDDTRVSAEVVHRVSPFLERLRGMGRSLLSWLPLGLLGVLLLGVTWRLARWVSGSRLLFRRMSDQPLLEGMLRQLLRTGIVLGGVIAALELLDLTTLVGAVLGTAGVVGLALGFAFQDIVENYLAALMLSFRHPFRQGDVIEIQGLQGKVMRMTGRDTVLMTFSGDHVRIPNATIFKNTLINYTANPLRRFDFRVGVGKEDDLAAVQDRGLAVLAQTPGVLAEPAPFLLLDELEDARVICHFYGWIDQRTHDLFEARSAAIRRIKAAFLEQGFDLAAPVYRVHVNADAPRSAAAAERQLDPPAPHVRPMDQVDPQIAKDQQASEEGDLLASSPRGKPREPRG